MEQIKRQNSNAYDNSKRKKFTDDTEKQSCTRFEDIPNEIICDIFECLDVYHLYTIFFDLNQRFQNLLTDSILPIKINLSSMSKSTFIHFYKPIIKHNKHRISLLRLSNLFPIDLVFPSIRSVCELTRLKGLHINNIQSMYIVKLLKYLVSLPKLSSLIITVTDSIEMKNKLYRRIFRLPALKYCKVTLRKLVESEPLPIAMNEFSPIEHLVLDNGCHLHELLSLLSYVPQLRRLSLYDLYGTLIESNPIVFNYLTHLSINRTNITFNELELLMRDYFQHIQVLYFLRSFSEEFLNARRWERLISSHIPQLRIFDMHSTIYTNNRINSTDLINSFNSTFWLERQWFFGHHIYSGSTDTRMTVFSTNPYRRQSYIIYGKNTDKYCSDPERIHLNTVHFICIENIKTIHDCNHYFPNATELTLSCKSIPEHRNSFSMILNRILPLKQLTKLVFDIHDYRVKTIFELLYFTTNIHTLILNCTSLCESSFVFIQQHEMYKLVSKSNKITNLIITTECTFEVTELLVNLCPQLQHLTINISKKDFIATLRFLLSKDNNSLRHLFFLCLRRVSEDQMLILNESIKSDKRFDHSFMKVSDDFPDNVYLWW